jgi:thymidylate kinase
MVRGKLIVFEGPDGVGKSRLIRALADRLRTKHIRHDIVSFPGKTPGSLGLHIRELHHDPMKFGIKALHPASLQTLHIAAHIDAIERRIRSRLEKGVWVILDRYWWSTWAYGTIAGVQRQSLEAMVALELTHWASIRPDVIILVHRQTPIGRDRKVEDHRQLLAAYSELAREQANYARVHVIENEGLLKDAVQRMLDAVADLLTLDDNSSKKRTAGLKSGTGGPSPRNNPTSAALPDDTTHMSRGVTHAFIRLAPPVPTEVYDTYWRFATERQAVFFRRLEGQQPPWSRDPILQRHKFTNAYRASDRVSQFLIRHVIYEGERDPEEVFFRTILFKFFNRIDTWMLLEAQLGSPRWTDYSFEKYDAALTTAMSEGGRIYSGAYIMPSVSSFGGRRKHQTHLRLLEQMMRDKVHQRIADAPSMRKAFEILRSYPGLGNFLAYQFIIDLNYSEVIGFSEMEFVVPGPGARDGIRKCFRSLGGFSEADTIRLIADRQTEEFERSGLRFQTLWGRSLQLVDCQNLFCEVAKYSRLAHPSFKGRGGRTRIKQLFRLNPQPIQYWYPPKWGLNDLIRCGILH